VRYKALCQFSYKRKWFEPGEEVDDIPVTEIRNLISQGIVEDLEPPVFRKVDEVEEGGDA